MHSSRRFSWAGRPVKASVVAGTGLTLIAPLLTVVVLRLAQPGPRARQTSTTYTTARRKQVRRTAPSKTWIRRCRVEVRVPKALDGNRSGG
jgi:hypothetical protein